MMADTIDVPTIRKVCDSLLTEVPAQAVVHTLVITLNGQHGGVDVTAGMYTPQNNENHQKTWSVT
jgi:hypothetical protein